jgi:hypothetical protein
MDSVSFHAMCMVTSFYEYVHEDSMQFSSQNSRFLCNHPDAPQCLEASALKTSGSQSNTVWTLGQDSPISTWNWISAVDTVWKVFARRSDDVATRPDAVQHFKYSSVPFECEKKL